MAGIKARIVTGTGAAIVAGGLMLGGVGAANAEAPSAGHSQCPAGKSGYNCQTDTGLGKKEQQCYENGGKGAVLGIFGGVPGVAGGAGAGCLSGILGWS